MLRRREVDAKRRFLVNMGANCAQECAENAQRMRIQSDRGCALNRSAASTYRKKLKVALPLDAINKASAREKSIRHGHPSTLHLWWARRPLAAARAVIFAQPDAPVNVAAGNADPCQEIPELV